MRSVLKTKVKNPKRSLAKMPAGKVGIFWVFQDMLLPGTFALSEGVEYGDAINGATDHVHCWPKFQESHPALSDVEYQDVPRGRVLFMKPHRQFHVYMDKVLHTQKIKRALMKEFQLPAVGTKFLTDAHYTTDPGELDRLFSE
jgi:hypothetical protein